MARLIVHDSYRQREDGTAEIFTNGAPVILQPDQYILLKGGVLLVVDEMAVAALDPRKLIQSSELNSAILTEGLYVQSSHGKLVVSQESEPIMTVRATSLRDSPVPPARRHAQTDRHDGLGAVLR